MMDIESARLLIEPITLDEGQMLVKNPMEYYYEKRIPYDVEWPHYSLKALLPYYLEDLENNKVPLGMGPWIIRDKRKGRIIGEAGFRSFDEEKKTVEIGYRILQKRQNQGYATEAVSSLCQWAFYQQIKKIRACCDKENIASQRVLKKNGFKKVANDKGLLVYEKRRAVQKKSFQGTNSL